MLHPQTSCGFGGAGGRLWRERRSLSSPSVTGKVRDLICSAGLREGSALDLAAGSLPNWRALGRTTLLTCLVSRKELGAGSLEGDVGVRKSFTPAIGKRSRCPDLVGSTRKGFPKKILLIGK